MCVGRRARAGAERCRVRAAAPPLTRRCAGLLGQHIARGGRRDIRRPGNLPVHQGSQQLRAQQEPQVVSSQRAHRRIKIAVAALRWSGLFEGWRLASRCQLLLVADMRPVVTAAAAGSTHLRTPGLAPAGPDLTRTSCRMRLPTASGEWMCARQPPISLSLSSLLLLLFLCRCVSLSLPFPCSPRSLLLPRSSPPSCPPSRPADPRAMPTTR